MEKAKSYLISNFNSKIGSREVHHVKVLESTSSCFRLEFLNDDTFGFSKTQWIEKAEFDKLYVVLEEYYDTTRKN